MKRLLALAAKDARLAGRTRDVLLSTLFFGTLVLMVLAFGLGPDENRIRAGAGAAVWTALALAAATAAGRAFAAEQEAGALEQLLLYPGSHEGVYLAKLLSTFTQLLVVAALLIVGGLALFDAFGGQDAPRVPLPLLGLTFLLGLLGLTAASTFYAAVTVNLRAREALLPALAFPVLVPVILAGTRVTTLLLAGDAGDEVRAWLTFLVAFDVGSIIVSALLFPYAVE
ncbi:heme exporter protein CcmB [Deinococcus maricopensis]|uniref:Cytochrome c-type biogenesis protein CcmB n=1 Tax=Deinococcus maricopensis (strain DSM 21211 / LMG 22137 / NRRL B-23946 / LB-34) TaxID=709986 RepID=E8U6W6_DEIML|nr:heme exporter protein CcmB [Deinococcus maricopensis]ADV66805.1 cytochrome c-type biogenesis protein CcmB [Deinococcus maricopensis DSM 21211]